MKTYWNLNNYDLHKLLERALLLHVHLTLWKQEVELKSAFLVTDIG